MIRQYVCFIKNTGTPSRNDATCKDTLLWCCVPLSEVYAGVECEDPFDTFWAQSGCRDQSDIATRRETAKKDVGWIIFIRICSEIISDILGILDSCWKRVFWGFAVIGIEHYTLGASGDKRTKFTISAESRYDKSRAVNNKS